MRKEEEEEKKKKRMGKKVSFCVLSPLDEVKAAKKRRLNLNKTGSQS